MNINEVANKEKPMNVEVGMGGTLYVGSDCYPVTVVHVSESGKTVKVQDDAYKIVENYANGSYRIETTPDPAGDISSFRIDENGRSKKKYGVCVVLGSRQLRLDPSF